MIPLRRYQYFYALHTIRYHSNSIVGHILSRANKKTIDFLNALLADVSFGLQRIQDAMLVPQCLKLIRISLVSYIFEIIIDCRMMY